MNSDTNNQTDNDWKEWLQNNWPKLRALDHNWTMERYDFPQYVRDGIASNWIKVNNENGGTWEEPEYNRSKLQSLDTAVDYSDTVDTALQKIINTAVKDDNGRSFAKVWKDIGFSKGMDDANKKGLDIMESEGMDAAVKYMFTDQESGRQLSYSEMRTRHG
jgi:hypothetical protein